MRVFILAGRGICRILASDALSLPAQTETSSGVNRHMKIHVCPENLCSFEPARCKRRGNLIDRVISLKDGHIRPRPSAIKTKEGKLDPCSPAIRVIGAP